MVNIRIIPRLDIKGPNLVKGIHLEGLRVLGEPGSFAQFYYAQGADEIFYMDCVASLYERNSLSDIIEKTAKSVFIPITVGGGIRSVEDIRKILKAGADKVCINTAAIKNPEFIKEASRVFGSSTIVVAIEAIRQPDGRYFAFVDNGREETGREVSQWAADVEKLGAGEIVITSVDREGTGEGFDLQLISSVTSKVRIPVIAHGGCSTVDNAASMVTATKASAICIASSFHYHALEDKALINPVSEQSEGNRTFLSSGRPFKKVTPFSISDLKGHLKQKNIPCRPVVL